MDDKFIKYRNYGYGLNTDIVLSYIVGWGNKGTYASNQHISTELSGLSVRSIQRALKFLNDKRLVKISNPKGKSRHIVSVTPPRQRDTPTMTESHTTMTESHTNHDTESHNKNSNKIKDKISNNTSNNITINNVIEKIKQIDLYTTPKEMKRLLNQGYKLIDIDGLSITKDDIDELFEISF